MKKNNIIVIVLLTELIGIGLFSRYFLTHFNQLSSKGASGLGILLVIFVIFISITPYILTDTLDNE